VVAASLNRMRRPVNLSTKRRSADVIHWFSSGAVASANYQTRRRSLPGIAGVAAVSVCGQELGSFSPPAPGGFPIGGFSLFIAERTRRFLPRGSTR
jgi:hypothetical protein